MRTIVHESQTKPTGYDLHLGQTLDDRFFITEIITRSGVATIFKATDLRTKQDVALKVPFSQFEISPSFFARFAQEVQIGEKFNHPYLLKFIPVEHRSRPYLVTEYLRGNTLAHLLKRVSPMPEKDALRLASRICEGLSHMHEHGVIHRDLKPHNIMLCFDGTIRIMDFGISKSIGKRFSFTGNTPAMGTPEYIAPEQIGGKRGDERTDIYSLGAMLYEMVVGAIPFENENKDVFATMNARITGDPVAPRALNRELSEQVEEIVLHAMERDPRKRYSTAIAMKEDLDYPGKVQLTGRCHRLRKPAPWKQHLKNVLLIVLTLAPIIFGFIQLILLIMRRGP